MARPEKEAAVAEMAEALEATSGIYLADFTGLTVEGANQLRRELRAQGVRYKVVKNTLTRLASKKAKREGILPYLEGPTGIALAGEDPLEPARVLVRFMKDHERPTIKVGLVEGRVVDAREVQRLAALPTADVLYAKFLGMLNSPLVGVLGVLTGLMSKTARVLAEVQKKKEAGGEAGA